MWLLEEKSSAPRFAFLIFPHAGKTSNGRFNPPPRQGKNARMDSPPKREKTTTPARAVHISRQMAHPPPPPPPHALQSSEELQKFPSSRNTQNDFRAAPRPDCFRHLNSHFQDEDSLCSVQRTEVLHKWSLAVSRSVSP